MHVLLSISKQLVATVLVATALALSLGVAACDPTVKTENKASDLSTAADQKEFGRMREELKSHVREELAEQDRRANELAKKAQADTSDNKTNLQSHLELVKKQRSELDSTILSLNDATAATWDQTKITVQKELAELKDALDQAERAD